MLSIIVVCLNAGDELKKTIQSTLIQSCDDFEIIIQDGMSTDNSIEDVLALVDESWNTKIRVFREKDKGIYDAMNKAVGKATGDYLLFLNSGDYLENEDSIKNIYATMKENDADIYYGYMKHRALDTYIYPAPEINDFTCYRNVPCHQTCIYSRRLFDERGYDIGYPVRGDYEHFLWCFYEKKAVIKYIDVAISSYEGGGFSETKENLEKSAKEHREIVLKYMGKKKANHYRRIMLLTLQPLRTKIAQSKYLSGIYNKVKALVYKK